MGDRKDVQPGTLALMILRTLKVMGLFHGYGIALGGSKRLAESACH